MKQEPTIAETRERIAEARQQGKRVAFVPTMGYLHEGHLSLVRRAKEKADFVVMSIFVNRIQFNDASDFEKYPQDLTRDASLAEEAGVDLLFTPDEDEMYTDRLTTVDVAMLTDHLCGAHRPGHFAGVFTVVSKLFNIVQPDVAVFGQKDIQQAVSLEKMVTDLNFPIEMDIAPIVREADGLAMSSRNVRLSEDERFRALALSRSLRHAEELLSAGERDGGVIADAVKEIIDEGAPTAIEYISLVRYRDLQPVNEITEKGVLALAVYYGDVRLIDNMIIELKGGTLSCRY